MKVILDTDIGTDVDDCLALAVLLGSTEVELVGTATSSACPSAVAMSIESAGKSAEAVR